MLSLIVAGRFSAPFLNNQSLISMLSGRENTMPRPLHRFIWISFTALAVISQAFAQGGATGAITGTVQDASGAFIANADVKVTNQDTKVLERAIKTGADGSFTVPLLPVGTYTVNIQSAGFAQSDFSGIVVRDAGKVALGKTSTLDIHGVSSNRKERDGKGAIGAGLDRALQNFSVLVGNLHIGVRNERSAGILNRTGDGARCAALGECLRNHSECCETDP